MGRGAFEEDRVVKEGWQGFKSTKPPATAGQLLLTDSGTCGLRKKEDSLLSAQGTGVVEIWHMHLQRKGHVLCHHRRTDSTVTLP